VLAERGRMLTEAAVLRTLGASRRQLGTLFALRFALLGGAASGLGVTVAVVAGAVACARFLDIPYQPSAWPIVAAVLLTTALVTATGALGVGRVISTPPMQSLRGV
jgi:putative ABC transport system permease protein